MAIAGGVSHKALVPVGGVPMIARVLGVLAARPDLGRILVSVEDPALLERVAALRPLLEAGRVAALASAPSPSASVLASLERLEPKTPLLETTAETAPDRGDKVTQAAWQIQSMRAAELPARQPNHERRAW